MPICQYNKKNRTSMQFFGQFMTFQQHSINGSNRPMPRMVDKTKNRTMILWISIGSSFSFIVWPLNACHRLWLFYLASLSLLNETFDETFYRDFDRIDTFTKKNDDLLFTLIQMGNKHKIMIKRLDCARPFVNMLKFACSMMNLHEIEHRIDRSTFMIAFFFCFQNHIHRLQLYSDSWYQILWLLSIYMSVCVRSLLFFCSFFLFLKTSHRLSRIFC